MPGTQSVNRTQTPTAIQPPSVEMAPTPEAKTPSVGQIRDDASSAIHRMQQSASVRGSRGMSMPQAVSTLAAAYDEGGIHAVNGALRENPSLVSALGGRSREQVENALEERLGGFETSSVMGAIQSEVTATLRRGVIGAARDRLGQTIQRVGRERSAMAGELDKLGAPPADPVRAAELEQGIATLDQVRDNLSELQTRFQGQAWDPGDFEQTARRASMRLGMGTGPHGTFVAEALRERAGDVEMDVHNTLSLAEIGAELPHILHGSGLALGVLAAGLYVGVEIHHAAEERRNEFIEAVHALGVR